MVRVTSLVALAAGALAAPVAEEGGLDFALEGPSNLARRQGLNYNQDWTSGGGVNYQSTSTGYSVSFSNAQDFVVGRGWNPGSQSK
jgi:endo-1,4-beta-xylanase